jgi:hypothetical protein
MSGFNMTKIRRALALVLVSSTVSVPLANAQSSAPSGAIYESPTNPAPHKIQKTTRSLGRRASSASQSSSEDRIGKNAEAVQKAAARVTQGAMRPQP